MNFVYLYIYSLLYLFNNDVVYFGSYSCMTSLQTSLGTIFLTRLTSGSLMKVLMPIINRKMKEQAESDGANLADMIEVERQFMLV